MSLSYRDLDEKTREYMLDELNLDIKEKRVNLSTYFNATGKELWIKTFTESIQKYDDAWLASQLQCNHCFSDFIPAPTKTGKRKVPTNAAETFAKSEFNRMYIRGTCLRAINEDIKHVIVYRGRQVEKPREDSEKKIGQKVLAIDLLGDLRSSIGGPTKLGIGEYNSGITVKFP